MVTHSSISAWKIPQTEESGRLQFMGLQRVGHNRAHTRLQPAQAPLSVGIAQAEILEWVAISFSKGSS